jgi:hypothetical protein
MTTIIKEEALQQFNIGWHSLINNVYAAEELPFFTGIDLIQRKNGMLSVKYTRTTATTHYQAFVLECLEYKIERLSAKLCEGCGKYGIRRTDLPVIQSLCTSCYALQYSEQHDSVPFSMANQEPQDD